MYFDVYVLKILRTEMLTLCTFTYCNVTSCDVLHYVMWVMGKHNGIFIAVSRGLRLHETKLAAVTPKDSSYTDSVDSLFAPLTSALYRMTGTGTAEPEEGRAGAGAGRDGTPDALGLFPPCR